MKSIKKLLISIMILCFVHAVAIVPDGSLRPVQEIVREALEEAQVTYIGFYNQWQESEEDLTEYIANNPGYYIGWNDIHQEIVNEMYNEFMYDIEVFLMHASNELVNYSFDVREQAMNEIRAYTYSLIQQMSVIMNIPA